MHISLFKRPVLKDRFIRWLFKAIIGDFGEDVCLHLIFLIKLIKYIYTILIENNYYLIIWSMR
jgi:hypothetical protein